MSQNNQIQNNTSQSQGGDVSGGVVFSLLGGFLLLVGVGSLIGSIWDDLPPVLQVLIGFLGIGAAHGIGFVATRAKNYAYSGSILHVVGMALFPTVINFLFNTYNVLNSGTPEDTAMRVFVIATTGALAYIPFAWESRRSIFVIFGLGNMMFALGALGYVAFEQSFNFLPDYIYLTLGILTACIAYTLRPVLYPFGFRFLSIVSVVGSAFYGFIMKDFVDVYNGVDANVELWFLWYPILAAATIYAGKELKDGLIKWTGIVALTLAIIRILTEIDDEVAIYALISLLGGWLVYFGYTTARKEKQGGN